MQDHFLNLDELSTLSNQEGLSIIYDGECPFCQNYVELYTIRSTVSDVRLVDARAHIELVDQLLRKGMNLNDGMVVIWEDRYYYADDAMHLLTILSSSSGVFGTINSLLFSKPRVAAFSYPVLVVLRKLLLFILRRKPIR